MARPLRIEFPGAFYHVTSRGNERKPIYCDKTDRRIFLDHLSETVERFNLLLHAYVLMTNHYHLLVETLEANLGRAMHALNGAYAKHFNHRHGRVGHLLAGRYKAILVERDTYLLELSRYIHLNPVRAGLVDHAEHYRWSSARAYLGEASPKFVTTADVLGHFGGTIARAQRRYRAFLRDGERNPPKPPWDRVMAGTLLGDDAWIEMMRRQISFRPEGDTEDDLEIPAISKLRIRPTLSDVVDRVATVMCVDPQSLFAPHSRTDARAVAMYLAYALGGLPQKEIGAAFGIGRFGVSKATTWVQSQLATDNRLHHLVDQLRSSLTPTRR